MEDRQTREEIKKEEKNGNKECWGNKKGESEQEGEQHDGLKIQRMRARKRFRNKIEGIKFNLILSPPLPTQHSMCVLTDWILLWFQDCYRKKNLNNYLERAPGCWESHYTKTTPTYKQSKGKEDRSERVTNPLKVLESKTNYFTVIFM